MTTRRVRRFEREPETPRWLTGGHVQTVLGHALPSSAHVLEAIPGHRPREIVMEDGERLLVHEQSGTSGVHVILMHGLSGDANADYMRRTAQHLREAGHGIWAVNHRGCGAGRGLAHRPYHSGKTEDLQALLAAARSRFEGQRILVIGFSLSGNLALLHAAQDHPHQPDGIIAISPPIDLQRATEDMARGANRLYQWRFLWRLRRVVRERERAGHTLGSYRIPLFSAMLAFDDIFTAPECGFLDGRDYYRQASSAPRLSRIRLPVIIVTAADDPFVDPRAFDDLELPVSVLLHISPTGGHVGYIERRRGRFAHWIDAALRHYVAELAGSEVILPA